MYIGEFVQVKGQIGTLVTVKDESIAVIDFVDDAGHTIERREVKLTSVAPAAPDDIPTVYKKV